MGLKGRSILTTRASQQSNELRAELERLGARVIEIPAIELHPPDDWGPVDAAIKRLASYDWVIFTSANAVETFLGRLETQPLEVPVAAIGPQTASKLAVAGIPASLVPEDCRAEGLAAAFPGRLEGKQFLLPRASRARDYLPHALRARGATVDVVSVYQLIVPDNKESLATLLKKQNVDCITFTSGSAIKNIGLMFDTSNLSKVLDGVAVSVIGPVTSKVATQFGLAVAVESPQTTMVALAKAIDRYFVGHEPVDRTS